MRKTKSGRRKPKRTRSRTLSGSRLSFNSLEPRNLLAAVASASFEVNDFVLDPITITITTEAHCEVTEENPCPDDQFNDLIPSGLDLPVAPEVDPEEDAGDSQPPAFRVDRYGGSSINRPVSPAPQSPPEIPNYPQKIRAPAASTSATSPRAPAEMSRLSYRDSLLPISILSATEVRSSFGTDVFSNEVDDSNYFLPAPTQKAPAPVFRSGLTAPHRTFSVIAVGSALEFTAHAKNAQSESRVAENQSSTTSTKTSVDAGNNYLRSRNLNQRLSVEAAGSAVRTITPATVSHLHLKSEEHIEISPSVKQTVVPILPGSPNMPSNLIDENRPLIDSKDGALARNLESTMILVIFHRRLKRPPQSNRKLVQSR